MPPLDKTQVRHYISPSDSADVVDYLINFFNRPDIPEIYSKEVAGIPVREDESIQNDVQRYLIINSEDKQPEFDFPQKDYIV